MAFKGLDSALDYLYRFTNYENMGRYSYSRSTFDLDRMRDLLAWCGHPELKIPTLIHVAGTKGKGSTCSFIAEILTAARKRTGLYTSPHLEDIRERISVNRQLISSENLQKQISFLKGYLDSQREGLAPTFFEIFTAIAFGHFADQGCEVGVIEVGLGGRLDSTNVIKPAVTVITPIHYDHTDKLGTELHQIAEEKAGILKEGIPVIIAPQPPEVKRILKKKTKEMNLPTWWFGEDIRIEINKNEEGAFDVVTPERKHEELHLKAAGYHQKENAGVALGVCDMLERFNGVPISDEVCRKALHHFQTPGRIEVFPYKPAIILDSAHNELSAKALEVTIRNEFKFNRLFLILGIASDKDLKSIVTSLSSLTHYVFATATNNPRAMSPHELANQIRQLTELPVKEFEKPEMALEEAKAMAGPEDLIVIAGSFYLAGELRPLIRLAEPFGDRLH